MSKLSKKKQQEDIILSVSTLSKILRKKINTFCYPYGGFNMFSYDTIKTFKELEIKYCFNVQSKNYDKNSNNFYIPRYDCNEFKHGQIFPLK